MAAETGTSSDSDTGVGNIASDQKIRDSCNACSSHKIRCTKERPACRRCASKGLACEYSVSRRNGKRRRSDAPNVLSVYPLEQASPAMVSSTYIPDEVDRLCDIDFRTQPTASDDSWMMDRTPETPDDANMQFFEPRAFGDFSRDPKDGDEMLAGGTVPEEVDGYGFGSGTHIPIPIPQAPTESFAALFGTGQLEFRGGQAGLAPVPSRSSRYTDQTNCSTTAHGRGQDCMVLALRIVTQMHVAPKSCSVSDSDPMHRPQSSKGESRDIDTVLQVNRDAVQLLNRILDCASCSSDHVCVLACYMAVQKIVAWYAAILGLDFTTHGTDLTGLVSTRPIFMGTFALDRDARRLVHTSVTLAEVRDHVQPLVARLSKTPTARLGNTPSMPSPSSSTSASCSDIAQSQGCALHEQVSRIMARLSSSK